MKSLVVYYSHSGNTAHIAYRLLEALGKKGEAEIFELRYRRIERNLLSALLYRIIPLRVELSNATPLDVEEYDVICIGIPVWGGQPAPPVSAYIKGCKNTDGKKIVCFLVYGIEGSAKRCLNYVKEILDKKGRSEIINMNVRWDKVHDEEFVEKLIQETVDRLFIT